MKANAGTFVLANGRFLTPFANATNYGKIMAATSLDEVKLEDLQPREHGTSSFAGIGNWIWLVALAPTLLLIGFLAL